MVRSLLLAVLTIFWGASSAAGSKESFAYQGRIIRPDGNVINSGTLAFTVNIFSPAPSECLLYSETHSVNMSNSQGLFTLEVGSGTRTDGGVHSFTSVFANGEALSGLNCSSGTTYTGAATDDRQIVVSFNDSGTAVSFAPTAIKSVPFALQAKQIEGWGLSNLVKVSSVGSPTTFTNDELAKVKGIGALVCAANEVLKWNGSAWSCAVDSAGGALGDAGYNAANKGVLAFDTDAVTSGITISSGVAKLSNTGVSAGTYGAAGSVSQVVVDAQGRVTSALTMPIQIASNQISVSGGTLGQVLKWNGSAWLPEADLGITSESDPTVQGFAKNGPSARFVTTGSVLELAASGVSAGTYGSGTQVPVVTIDAFGRITNVTNTAITGVSPVGAALNAAQFWVGNSSNAAVAVSMSGDVSLYDNGSLTVNRLQGQALRASSPNLRDTLMYNGSAWVNANIPSCAANQYLTFNGSYFCGTDTGSSGLVTSVDVAVPSFMSTSGGPVTSSGIISLGLQNQNANLVFAGPASGGAAAPSFRSLASEDIPALDAAKISTGTLPVSRGGTGSGAALANNKVMVSSWGAIVEGDSFGSAKANNSYVLRDGSGGFAAGAVTVDSSILKGATSGSLTLQVPASVTSYSLTFPGAVGSAGQMLATDALGNLSWITDGGVLSKLTGANATNTMDSLNFSQIWNWSTATTQTPMTINANALTTGGILHLASSSTSLSSINGLLYVGNTGAGTTGVVFRAQSNSAADSGLSVLANGNVGIGTTSVVSNLRLQVRGVAAGGQNVIATGASVDLSLGNTHVLQNPGGSVISLQNAVAGATYTLVIEDLTTRTYSFSGCSNTYFSPMNGDTLYQSTYTILVTQTNAGLKCYVTWMTGFN